MVLLCLMALGSLFVVERFKVRILQPYYAQKIAAARLAEKCFAAVKAERLRRDAPIDPETDPAQTGLVGMGASLVTSDVGDLAAKRTTINPNFAAVVVGQLKECGARPGDIIAIQCTGSFPAMNINVLAAIETLNLQPILITSASSSSWGANFTNFLWLDIEKTLYEAGLIHTRSVAVSVGGIEDRGLGMSRQGVRIITNAIASSGLPFIAPKDNAESVRLHMETYSRRAQGREMKVLVNVGGLATSLGGLRGKHSFKPGINRVVPPGALLLIVATLWTFVRMDVGLRFLQSLRSKTRAGHPEPMI